MKKRKPLPSEMRKDGTFEQKVGKKTYEVRTKEVMGSDGVVEDHFTYVGAKGTIISIARNLKCRNIMSDADRKRLGIQ